MKFMKIKLLIIAVIMFAASSAFASLSYDVTVDTSSLNGTSGYLYLVYGGMNQALSTSHGFQLHNRRHIGSFTFSGRYSWRQHRYTNHRYRYSHFYQREHDECDN